MAWDGMAALGTSSWTAEAATAEAAAWLTELAAAWPMAAKEAS
jgi:hypothetical protein